MHPTKLRPSPGAVLLLACSTSLAVTPYRVPETLNDGWPTVTAEDARLWNTALLDQLATKIEDGTYKSITSVVVVQHGRLVHEAYFNDGARDRLNDTRSAMKSV
jgi:hypothetical protein